MTRPIIEITTVPPTPTIAAGIPAIRPKGAVCILVGVETVLAVLELNTIVE